MLALATVALVFALYLVGEVATYPQRRRQTALKRAAVYGRARREATTIELGRFHERVLEPSVKRLAHFALKLNPRSSAEAIGTRLLAAGLSPRVSATQFLAAKAGLAIGGVAVAI